MGKVAIAACVAVLAFTLDAAGPSRAQTPSQGAVGTMNGHPMTRAGKLSGEPIYNAQGQQIGTLEETLIDPSGGPAMVVLSPSNGGKRRVLPVTNITHQNGKMVSQLELERMHEFDWNTFYGGGGG